MEALVAVGLASNILQFITFSTDLLSTSKEIYSSVGGSTKKVDDLNDICQCLANLTLHLTPEKSPESLEQLDPDVRPSADDIGLVRLSNRCRDTSLDIQKRLGSLKLGKSPPTRSKIQSLRLAIKLTLSKHVERLQEKLDKHRDDLMLYLQVVSQQNDSSIMKLVEELKQVNLGAVPEHQEKLDEIINLVTKLRTETGVVLRRAEDHNGNTVPLKSIAESLKEIAAASSRDLTLETEIVASLHFEMLQVRHTAIHDAHRDTFEWLLKPRGHKRHRDDDEMPDVNLLEWLKSGSGIYWISGKPGCGKSTLMKLIAGHRRTREALDEWAGVPNGSSEGGDTSGCITAAYYFWSAGTQLQKSIEGLLRTLLFDILKQAPELTPIVFPKRWAALGTANLRRARILESTEWKNSSLPELTEALRLLTREPPPAAGQAARKRFCFFIDGLDEFHGDHRELVKILCEMAPMSGRESTLKLCVSSRPWNVFEDSIGVSAAGQRLHVHDLTRGDIMAYINKTLCGDRNWVLMTSGKPKYNDLVNEITNRARGVFLWVVLVVKSVLEGLSNGDSLGMLEKRVSDMPQELDLFFRHILDSIPREYHRHMAIYFRVALHASSYLHPDASGQFTLMHFSFLDDQLESEILHTRGLPVQPMNEDDISYRFELMNRRLNARCKGLLEAHMPPLKRRHLFSHQVEFLHRTVHDFLGAADMADVLDDLAGNTPVNLLMLKACVALYKSLPDPTDPTDPFHNIDLLLLNQAMYYAHKAECEAALDAEDEVQSAAQIEAEDVVFQAIDDLRLTACTRNPDEPPDIFDFSRTVAENGLCGYISANIDLGSVDFTDIQSLLESVLKVVGKFEFRHINFLNTISMLLRKLQLQGRPISISSSLWGGYLGSVARRYRRGWYAESLSYHKQVFDLIIPHVVDVNGYDAVDGKARLTVPWAELFIAFLSDRNVGSQREQCDTCVQILQVLFSSGADPNGCYKGRMIWSVLCEIIYGTGDSKQRNNVALNFFASVTVLLLKAGADTSTYPLSEDVVRNVFPPRLASQICSLLPAHKDGVSQAGIRQVNTKPVDTIQADTTQADTTQADTS